MTAREIVLGLPSRLKTDDSVGQSGTFHFQLEGENGGDFTVSVADGVCKVTEGLTGEADCVISATASDFEDAEEGRVNRQMAVMMGKIKISNLGAMLKFIGMFKDLDAA
ncbi:MAG TPA: SCP2 sterol-binding domain-containing protein [Chitinophagales bacterium]|jgi:putative sterol carrier protein|nr:SCP2 sterol-binding domain-containing protein [Chitinophagales bacterium]HQG37628.1 SCP2 sterol-binding domain-containing protein [Chitinophagales bacterium]